MGRRGEHSKSEIESMALEAAEAIIESQGYSGLSARKVASAIGYTVGSLYFVFRNLDELVLRINGRTLDQLHTVIIEALTECRFPQQGVLAMSKAYLDFAAQHPHRWRMIFEHYPRDESLSMEINREKLEGFYVMVEKQLKALAARPDEEIEVAARAIWNGVHGVAAMTTKRAPRAGAESSAHQISRNLIGHYLNGLDTTEINSMVAQRMERAAEYPK
jgi:AcrR family transcriptional regulator